MKYPITGIILSGGLSTRLSGKNKAFIEINGRKIIEYTHALFSEIFQEIILVTNTPALYQDWDFKIVTDIFQERSSMTGLHAGLHHASFPFAFAVACDSPFLDKTLIETVLSHVGNDIDIVVPRVAKGYEPLFAVYSKRCLPVMENALKNKRFRIKEIFDQVQTTRLPESFIRRYDPDMRSFFNINTPDDMAKAIQTASGQKDTKKP